MEVVDVAVLCSLGLSLARYYVEKLRPSTALNECDVTTAISDGDGRAVAARWLERTKLEVKLSWIRAWAIRDRDRIRGNGVSA
jgi:hypothetical protein